jgi:hypothetical protein
VLAGLVAAGALGACSASPATGAAGTGGDTGTTHASSASGTGGAGDDCATVCATEAKACPKTMASACTAVCEVNKSEITWCTAIVTTAIDCLAKQPASSFQCDMNGQAVAKSGVCPNETAAWASCWDNGPPGGLPDLTQACSAYCSKESGLSCADPNCTADCAKSAMSGQKCNGAFAALVACAAKQDAANFICTTGSPPLPALKPGFCAFEGLLLFNCLQH